MITESLIDEHFKILLTNIKVQSLELWRLTNSRPGLFWFEYDSLKQFLTEVSVQCRFIAKEDLIEPNAATLTQLATYDPNEKMIIKFIISVTRDKYIARTFLINKDDYKTVTNITSPPKINNGALGSEVKERQCGFCLDISKNKKSCSKCGTIFYCDRNCQQQHWSTHKLVCGRIAEELQSLK